MPAEGAERNRIKPPSLAEGGCFMAEKRAIVFANGEINDLEAVRGLIESDDFLVAADGGYHHMQALGLRPGLIVGDMDSLSKEETERLQAEGVQIELHPKDKNETDLELALQWAARAGYPIIVVVGALGGRLDQTLGNVCLLAQPGLDDLQVRLLDGNTEAFLIHGRAEIRGDIGDIVSLLPLFGPAVGVLTAGLRYPLHRETLYPERTRGISNVLERPVAQVELSAGNLLCIHIRRAPVQDLAERRE
jgi:thiamine pyrophosphokinase